MSRLTDKTFIDIFKNVYNKLGLGYRENIYENAICLELKKENIEYEQQGKILIEYDNEIIGEQIADICIPEYGLVIELKALPDLNNKTHNQIIPYIKNLNYIQGYIINYCQNSKKEIQITWIGLDKNIFVVKDYNTNNTFFYNYNGLLIDYETVKQIKKEYESTQDVQVHQTHGALAG
jgi:GxxExxY protein